MRRDIEDGCAVRVLAASELGATWREVAAAVDLGTDDARALLRGWAAGQAALHEEAGGLDPGNGLLPGLSPEDHEAVLRHLAPADDGPAPPH
jgi:hypothetical protein